MKNKILITLLLISNFLFSQNNYKLDQDSFILGMFNDYNGRLIALTHNKESSQLTSFYCSQNKLKQVFLDTLKKYYNTDDVKVENGVVYSKSLAKHFNNYYKIKKVEYSGFAYDGIDYDAYSLTLKSKIFTTNDKKISFILGAFYRYGKIENNEVLIKIANSISHFRTIQNFLKKVGFKYHTKEICHDCIPVVRTVVFTPSKEYLPYFLEINIPKSTYEDCNKNGL